MPRVHSKLTNVTIDGDALTTHTNNSQVELSADTHDTTTFGKGSHVFDAGLKNGTATLSGFYDSTALTGPRAILAPLVGAPAVELIHQPEGTGSGKPQTKVDVLVTKYTETAAVADMVMWAVDLQFTDDVDLTAQSA